MEKKCLTNWGAGFPNFLLPSFFIFSPSILPGSTLCSKNKETFTNHRIGAALAVNSKPTEAPPPVSEFHSHVVPLEKRDYYILPHLEKALDFIETHVAAGNNILVHWYADETTKNIEIENSVEFARKKGSFFFFFFLLCFVFFFFFFFFFCFFFFFFFFLPLELCGF